MVRTVPDEHTRSASIPSRPVAQASARALIGYRRVDVDTALDAARASIATARAEKAALARRIERLEAEIARHEQLAPLLQSTLISAERAADTLRQRARTETDELLDNAQAQARRLTATARAEREGLERETGRRLALLRSALAILESRSQAGATDGSDTTEPGPEALVETLHEQIRRLTP
jgi:cell division septum initiation protein DivIVA